MPQPIRYSGAAVDLSPRVVQTVTVSASPAAAAETVIATTPALGDVAFAIGVLVFAFASITIGTSGANLRLRVRQTNVSGTVVADSGTTTGGIAAGNVCDINANGLDSSPAASGQLYVVTAQVGSAAAASTVGFVSLVALAV